jgi:Hemolysin-type calcium-binding repeat (2 copies).
MSKTINLPGYIIDSGGTFVGTAGKDDAGWGGFATSPVVIYLLGGDDIVGGGQFYDKTTITIFGGDGNDRLAGNGSVENFYGGKGNDMLLGNNLNDVLHGDSGNDSLLGKDGNDTLFGGKGDDYILGDDGDDSLVGGQGINIVYGGGGKDIFIIENFGQPGNYTNIQDFVKGQDKIVLTNGLSFEALTLKDSPTNLIISLHNSSEPIATIVKTISGQRPVTVSLTKDDFLSI